jgi:predicted permease
VSEFLTVLQAVLPVFCLALIGVVLRKVEWLTEEADASLMRVVVNVLTPALILDKVLGNTALRRPENLLLPPVLGFGGVAIGLAICWMVRKRLGFGNDRVERTFVSVTGIQNYGYVPLPLIEQLFPGNTTGVLFVHNLGVDTAMWTLCLIVLGHGGWRNWRRLITAPIIAIIGALALNTLHADVWLPKFALSTAHMLGACCFPLGIVLIGATLADSSRELRADLGLRPMLWSCLFRLGLLPILMLTLAHFIPASRELKQVLIVQAAMPAAVFPIVLARHYGGDALTSIRVVIGTSLVGFFTIPLWLRIGMKVVSIAPH